MNPALRYYHRRAAAFREQGLTTRGRPYRRHPNFRNDTRSIVDRARYQRRYWRERARRRSARNIAMGLTTRGTIRRASRLGRTANPIERAWLSLRNAMDVPDTSFLSPLERGQAA